MLCLWSAEPLLSAGEQEEDGGEERGQEEGRRGAERKKEEKPRALQSAAEKSCEVFLRWGRPRDRIGRLTEAKAGGGTAFQYFSHSGEGGESGRKRRRRRRKNRRLGLRASRGRKVGGSSSEIPKKGAPVLAEKSKSVRKVWKSQARRGAEALCAHPEEPGFTPGRVAHIPDPKVGHGCYGWN